MGRADFRLAFGLPWLVRTTQVMGRAEFPSDPPGPGKAWGSKPLSLQQPQWRPLSKSVRGLPSGLTNAEGSRIQRSINSSSRRWDW